MQPETQKIKIKADGMDFVFNATQEDYGMPNLLEHQARQR